MPEYRCGKCGTNMWTAFSFLRIQSWPWAFVTTLVDRTVNQDQTNSWPAERFCLLSPALQSATGPSTHSALPLSEKHVAFTLVVICWHGGAIPGRKWCKQLRGRRVFVHMACLLSKTTWLNHLLCRAHYYTCTFRLSNSTLWSNLEGSPPAGRSGEERWRNDTKEHG